MTTNLLTAGSRTSALRDGQDPTEDELASTFSRHNTSTPASSQHSVLLSAHSWQWCCNFTGQHQLFCIQMCNKGQNMTLILPVKCMSKQSWIWHASNSLKFYRRRTRDNNISISEAAMLLYDNVNFPSIVNKNQTMNENECTVLSLLIASKHCTSLRFISTSYTASTKFLDFSTDDHENIRWGKVWTIYKQDFISKMVKKTLEYNTLDINQSWSGWWRRCRGNGLSELTTMVRTM